MKINYITGDSGDRIETMALASRAVTSGQKALIIDDFMKSGGTMRGMHDLMKEFSVDVVARAWSSRRRSLSASGWTA